MKTLIRSLSAALLIGGLVFCAAGCAGTTVGVGVDSGYYYGPPPGAWAWGHPWHYGGGWAHVHPWGP